MTGDRLETDVRMGLDAGMAAALTLTGATTEAMLRASAIEPTSVLRCLSDLVPPGLATGGEALAEGRATPHGGAR